MAESRTTSQSSCISALKIRLTGFGCHSVGLTKVCLHPLYLPFIPSSSASFFNRLTHRFLFSSSGSVCAAGTGQLTLSPGRPALRGPDPADQWAELCRLEHRQGPQGPEGSSRDSHRAGGPGQVRRSIKLMTWSSRLPMAQLVKCRHTTLFL